jgi:hypothetical protein
MVAMCRLTQRGRAVREVRTLVFVRRCYGSRVAVWNNIS